MKQLHKFRSKSFLNGILTVVILCTVTWKTAAMGTQQPGFRRPLTNRTDTSKIIRPNNSLIRIPTSTIDTPKNKLNDTLNSNDSVRQRIDTFNLKLSKDSLDAPLKYEARDSAVIVVKTKIITLYGKTKIDYKDIGLTSPQVQINQQTQIVTAVNAKDSTGEITETAHFKSGANEFTSDTIRYNFKTGKGLTKSTYTTDEEGFIHGEVVKKVDENITFIKKARFTTCDLDDPHFAFISPRMKIINKKLAISGPTHPEFEGVPIPIYLPFGFFPLSQGRHSGLLPPQFTTNEQYGLGLEGLGYYKVLSENWDAKLYGNVYSYGGWVANLNPTYRRRYRYQGAFNISAQSTKQSFKGDPDFFKTNTYFVTWTHTVDSRARPGTTFSASVNAGSTKFNRLSPNSQQYTNNSPLNFQNQLGSSIAYSKSWAGKPYNLTLSANHNQNNLSHLINVSLPDAGFSVSTIYPFQPKDFAGTPKWYQKLGIGYNGSFRNQLSFYDTAFKFKKLLDTLQWGASHNIPITLSLPPILNGAVIVSPSISYSQVWIAEKVHYKWNTATKKLDTTSNKGFYTDHSAQVGVGLSSAIYGTYYFKHSRIYAIRHVIRPTLSFNYKPDLSKSHFYTTQVDTSGYKIRFSEFERSLYGSYSEGRTGGMTLAIDNNLEMKWRSRKDTGENAIKKIKLIDGYGISSSYNFLADSMKLDLVQIYLRTTLFDKISITANTVLDPYQTNSRGDDISKFAWQGDKFSLGRLTYGSISMSTSFQSKPKDPAKAKAREERSKELLNDPSVIADQARLLDYMRQNPAEFVDFNIPWQVNLGYSLYFSNTRKADFSGFEKKFTSNANFSGSFSLTPKWNFSVNGYFDFDTRKLQTFQMSINREMHCWQMSINVTPVGLYRSFNFSISPKASLLQDLRINRRRSFSSF